MKNAPHAKLGGRLMMGAGAAFFLVAILGRQPAFSGLGATFFVLGIASLRRASKPRPDGGSA